MDIYAFMDAYGLWFALALFVASLAYSAWRGWRTRGRCDMEAFAAFAQANWPYAAAILLLLFAWLFWTLDHAPELPWHD